MATNANPISFQSSTDPRKIAENQRALVWGKGDVLGQEQVDLANQAEGNSNAYLGSINNLENQYMAGQGGYTPQEASAIQGNPQGWQQYYNPMAQGLSSAATQEAQGLSSAASNPANLQSGQAVQNLADAITGGTNGLNSQLDTMDARVRGAIDPNALSQSQNANAAEQFGPAAQQAMVTGAGISAGLQDQAAVDAMQRSALAAGSSPAGVAAYRARMARQQAIDSGNAMTQARATAAQLGMQGATTAEQQRLGAQQYLTGRQVGAEQQLGQFGVTSRAADVAQRVNAIQNTEAQRIAAQQGASQMQMNAAATGGQAQMGAATTSGQAGMYGQQNADVNASNRAAAIGQMRIGQQNVGLAGQKQTQSQMNQNAQNAYQRQQQTYGTQTGAGNQAANMGLAASQTPSTWDKIAGGIAGGLGAVAGFIADGDVATSPQLRVLGEDGPEAVVPYRARIQQALKGASGALAGASGSARLGQPQPQSPWARLAGSAADVAGAYRARRGMSNALQTTGNQLLNQDLQNMTQVQPPQVNPPQPPEQMNQGKIVTKPTLAVIGEDEPEAVVPLNFRARAKTRPSMVAV